MTQRKRTKSVEGEGKRACVASNEEMSSSSFVTPPLKRSAYKRVGVVIGNGAYATVYRGVGPDGEDVVLKMINARDDEEDGISASSGREIGILRTMTQQKNIIRLLDVEIHTPRELCLVFEAMACDLATFIHHGGITSRRKIVHIAKQILNGLADMHFHSFFHRDLKPANVLLNRETDEVKIGDLGLAHRYMQGRAYTLPIVTLPYRAPELMLGQDKYTPAIDIWSLGCIIAEMFHSAGHPPLFWAATGSQFEQLICIFRRLGTPKQIEGCDEYYCAEHFPNFPAPQRERNRLIPGYKDADPAVDLIKKMLAMNVSSRISASDALSHPFFK